MNKYIIYDKSRWERQFIFQDLLNIDILNYNKIIYTNNELNYEDISKWKNLYNINDIINNNIFIFSSNHHTYSKILDIVKLLKPIIIIHLSDEWGNKEEFQNLYKYTKLLLRQYYHSHYYQKPNIKHISLGYMNGMLETNYLNLPLKLPINRKYIWSFIGNMKSDRQEMLNKMNLLTPNYIGRLNEIEMRNIYRDSIFVPNGRGNVKLDCFRLYEASLCGAIPIIVGDKKEIEETFCQEDNPPWLTFNNWDEAQCKCSELLKNIDNLNKISQKIIKWWHTRVLKQKQLIFFKIMFSTVS